jgi:outer membrane protein OmpA-like peptidoglycan-associated protein
MTTFAAMQAQKPAAAAAADAPWLRPLTQRVRQAGADGFPWLRLEAKYRQLRAIGEAPSLTAKESALVAIEAAQMQDATGAARGFILTDMISAPGEGALGAALASLGDAPTRVDCQAAFEVTLAGRTINFDTASASISPSSARLLDTLTAVALSCPAYQLEVAGHTDRRGRPAANLALSLSRAEAVRAYLISKGVPEGQLTAQGYGSARPIDPNNSAEADARNRRIEFVVRDPA